MGGMNATVDGITYSGVVSANAAVAPGCPYYKFNIDWTIGLYANNACGTSLSTPQVGSAAIQVKDRFLGQGYTAVLIEGRMSVILQAMTDRQNAQGFKKTSGFDPLWGGGRFQARYLSAADMGSPYGWETFSAVLSDNQLSNHSVRAQVQSPPASASSSRTRWSSRRTMRTSRTLTSSFGIKTVAGVVRSLLRTRAVT
jgi:hypothetical protein